VHQNIFERFDGDDFSFQGVLLLALSTKEYKKNWNKVSAGLAQAVAKKAHDLCVFIDAPKLAKKRMILV